MALAFLFGVAFGWVMWGAKPETLADGASDDSAPIRSGDPSKELVVIKAELEAVRKLLDEKDGEEGDIGEQLSSLDDTVKRANGRLKVILAAIKRAASGR